MSLERPREVNNLPKVTQLAMAGLGHKAGSLALWQAIYSAPNTEHRLE